MASDTYNGILVRASLQDTGSLPRTPPLRESPDVSPQGSVLIGDPVKYFTDTYDQNVGKPVLQNQTNFVYIRGKNIGVTPQAGVAYLYWARESDINTPSRWKNNQLLTTGGDDKLALAEASPGDIVIGDVPFVWEPPSDTSAKNYELIGVIATNDHPNPVPGLRDVGFKFDTWVTNQGGVGTLQTTVQPPPKPSATVSTTGLYDLKNKAGDVSFFIKTTGIPIGSQVSFKAAKPDAGGGSIDIPLTTVNQDVFKTGTEVTLDADYSSPITFNLFLKSGTLPAAGNTVTLYVGIYEEALGKAEKGEHRVYAEESGTPKFVILAQYTTTINVPVQK